MSDPRPASNRALRSAPWTAGLCLAVCLFTAACEAPEAPIPEPSGNDRPAILLVTLDTTRADVLGYESGRARTPNLDALAARGQSFSQAYSTAPMTLPSHTSMLTGLYPGDHGIHENARRVDPGLTLLPELLGEVGYQTAAFVSALPLAGQFGLDRGFDRYDDAFGGEGKERRADATTDLALGHLEVSAGDPLFLWVHYFDPHEPYDPPVPFRSRHPNDPYLGEIEFMDRELGRLVAGFERHFADRPTHILVAGDHGEGLGDHGENLHGNLLYQGVIRVPLIVVGDDLPAARVDQPVSVRRVFDTILKRAGARSSTGPAPPDLLHRDNEIVMAEAMKPYLQYGWQPQIMAVRGGTKVIYAGETEVYDVVSDPAESTDLLADSTIDPEVLDALREYPLPSVGEATRDGESLSREDRERLASLGYVVGAPPAGLRQDAPTPRNMAYLFDDLDRGSALFIQRRYGEAIPLFETVLEQDPGNFVVALRLAVAHSVEGHPESAIELFALAERIDPDSIDLQHYLAMHHLRGQRWELAAPLFESVLRANPDRVPALESLAIIREREGRLAEAAALTERVARLKSDPITLLRLGQLRMTMGDTEDAVIAFERASELQGEAFPADLQLGVLYLAAGRLIEAAGSLDRVPPDHPGYPMALFKRAQVSVLLAETDSAERVRLAYREANPTTRPLIEREPLFRGIRLE